MTEATQTASGPHVPPPESMPRMGSARGGRILVAIALVAAFLTFLILTGLTPVVPTHQIVVSVLAANALLVVVLAFVVVREILALRRARRIGQAASRLHERVVRLFVIVATIPVIIVSVAASITLDRGLDSIFSSGVQRAVDASTQVAESYVREQIESVRAETAALVTDIDRIRGVQLDQADAFRRFLTAQAFVRGFAVIRLLRQDGSIVDRAEIELPVEFSVPAVMLTEAAVSDDILLSMVQRGERDFIQALLRLRPGVDEFLFVVRPINQRIGDHLRATQQGVFEYQQLRERRTGVQVAFALMFALTALLVTLSAVYLGLSFANRLVQPIRRLIGAADQVAGGNLATEVHIRRSEGDLANLGETFNKMTMQLRQQREDLVRASDQIDSRRRFIEAVLAGVSAGVVGLDEVGRVTLFNPTAAELLGKAEQGITGQPLTAIMPELSGLIAEAERGPSRLVQGQVTIVRAGRERTLVVRVASERDDDGAHGAVVTIDDVTELVVAQRTSAWADIARRIAHEIKNPLTPIQLSAERLKRRYGRAITEDREVFEQCTDTIIRQVGDIGRMVDEFSSFARMPKPVFAEEDVVDTVRQVVFLMRMGSPDVTIDEELPAEPWPVFIDRRLISQAVTNIVKNATEAIHGLDEAVRNGAPGRILVRFTRHDRDYLIDVIDNGIGLPKENRHRLLEPYVTNRAKGTGLGLAIVGKIMEEHGGGIELLDAPADAEMSRRGAMIRLRFRDQRAALAAE